jgi:DNA-binding response OmpR family regulator
MKILLIEDDHDLGKLLREYLKLHAFEVDHATTGSEAKSFFQNNPYDLITVDIMLPDSDGMQLAKQLHEQNPDVPFIFITARNQKEDVIKGLKTGAEDYITKPFEPEELVLRINIALRKVNPVLEEKLQLSSSLLLRDEMKLSTPGDEHKLTAREYELLSYLFRNPNRIIKREELLEKFWGENDYFKGRSMDVFISRFRKYLKDDEKLMIETYRGTGIILKEKS